MDSVVDSTWIDPDGQSMKCLGKDRRSRRKKPLQEWTETEMRYISKPTRPDQRRRKRPGVSVPKRQLQPGRLRSLVERT